MAQQQDSIHRMTGISRGRRDRGIGLLLSGFVKVVDRALEQSNGSGVYCEPSLDVYLYLARNRHAGPMPRTLLRQTYRHTLKTG